MIQVPVIAVLDVGKTNKKLILFDELLNIRLEKSTDIPEIADDDGFPCEDIGAITQWVKDSIQEASDHPDFNLKAVNFSAHGASFVHQDEHGKVIAPLHDYLKPYPEHLRKAFYTAYGGEAAFSRRTASPVLGSLNSGLQLYRIKYEQPALFNKTKTSLHLPQYLYYLLAGNCCSDITSIGCHTALWDFEKDDYHPWVRSEGIFEKLAPISPCDTATKVEFQGHSLLAGIGLHDSSAALIPYFNQFEKGFILLSTGTWNITLNPFNAKPLTEAELSRDCLCYLNYLGKPVKASRLYAGHAHQKQVERIAEHFHLNPEYHQDIAFDPGIIPKLSAYISDWDPARLMRGDFFARELSIFKSFEEAYSQLIIELVGFQRASTSLVLSAGIKDMFVDGGFSKNKMFMNCLAAAFPELKVSAAAVAQASSLGAAMVIHHAWSSMPVRSDIIELHKEF